MAYVKSCACKGIRSCIICEVYEGSKSTVNKSRETVDYIYCVKCNKAWAPSDEHTTHSCSDPGLLDFNGIAIETEFVTPDEESILVEEIYKTTFVDSQSGRRKQYKMDKSNIMKRKRDRLADDEDSPDCKKRASNVVNPVMSDKVYIGTETRSAPDCEVPRTDGEELPIQNMNDLFNTNEIKCDIETVPLNNSSESKIQIKFVRNQTKCHDGSIQNPADPNFGILKRQFSSICSDLRWITYNKNNLNYAYTTLYGHSEADAILGQCEKEIVYNTGLLAQVKVFGKIHNIPRKQVAFGDAGLTYTFSGSTVPANPWPKFLVTVRARVEAVSGERFNFVLVNRYNDGDDHIGEHKDDEKDLVPKSSVASVSFGQPRDFLFKHQDARGKKRRMRPSSGLIDLVSIELGHGSLLLMKDPTNKFWYHSLPKRKRARGVRVNFTFRNMSQG